MNATKKSASKMEERFAPRSRIFSGVRILFSLSIVAERAGLCAPFCARRVILFAVERLCAAEC